MGQTLPSPWERRRSMCSLYFIQSSAALVPLCSLAWGSGLKSNREWCRPQALNHAALSGSRAFHFCLGSCSPVDTEYDGTCLSFFLSVHALFTDSQNVTSLSDLLHLMKWERQSHSNLVVHIYASHIFEWGPMLLNLLLIFFHQLCDFDVAPLTCIVSLPSLSFLAVQYERAVTCMFPG